jgi:hypothetical protein
MLRVESTAIRRNHRAARWRDVPAQYVPAAIPAADVTNIHFKNFLRLCFTAIACLGVVVCQLTRRRRMLKEVGQALPGGLPTSSNRRLSLRELCVKPSTAPAGMEQAVYRKY